MNKQIFSGFLGLCSLGLGLSAQANEVHSVPFQPLLVAHAGHDHGAGSHAQPAHGHKVGAAASGAAASRMAGAPMSTTLTVSGCWIRSMPAPAPSGGYFVVSHSGSKPVQLIAASSTGYGMVMLHQTTHKDGMSRMSATHGVPIPAGGQLEFKPGAYHAMLEDPVKAHPIGSKIVMDFLFDNGEKASAECEIKPANTRTPMSH
ncbi:copper transporter [Pollutimonas nitritireducens]|uniref:Copper transporter n=1 Tax=Pollutimonas nitritireducens TaxID=2045209 RepID=A0A2N4UBD7_9BURK|nr:copper chaperone PCu(A)C [Pollutimonas nitritireducens]PLC52336.1 copper transporter [Pollutimonas nitritireducens]